MRQKGAKMIKCNKLKTTVAATVVFAFLCAVFLFITSGGYEQWKEENSGIPDALSSISDGTTCRLIVVANRSGIRDAEEFAEEVIKMCRENSFRSLRLSTDIEGWPEKLDIRVYLRKRDVGGKDPLMQILYEPVNDGEKYDIRDNREKYRMTILETE